jgi:succinate-semialdehyde dehydrogenase/glutarate-semialdehyde dehydrogenase
MKTPLNPIFNPSNLEIVGEVPDLARENILEAVERSQRAFNTWSKTTARERTRILRSITDKLRAEAPRLAQVLTSEQGKPLIESRGELVYGALYFEWFSEEAPRAYGRIIPSPAAKKQLSVLLEPIGVVATITPWNFPHAMIARKLAAALAAGCTLIAKPAPETPLSAIELQKLCREAGLPEDVFQVVTGDAQMIGECFMHSKLIKKISFTGSTEVGRLLIRNSAETVKKLTLELGGNAPFIVFDDADLDSAVQGAVEGKFRNAGQTCISLNRFFIHKNIADIFTEKFSAQVQKLVVGDGFDPRSNIGPLISKEAYDKVKSLTSDALQKGASCVLGKIPEKDTSLFFPPCILRNIRPEMEIAKTEVFGPVSAIQTFETDDQAICMANDTPYGLASYFYTKNIARIEKVKTALQFGMVGINTTFLSSVEAPFGGIKESGFGREGGSEGMLEYMNVKFVALDVG